MPTGPERQLFGVWLQLSQEVHRLRHTPQPTASNELLRSNLAADQDGPLAPLLLLWIGDNCLLEGRFDEAIQTYEELVARYPDRRFGGQHVAGIALQQIAVCRESLGQFDEAAGVYQRVLHFDPEGTSPAWLHREIGRMSEAAGRTDEAIQAYRQASEARDTPSHTMVSIPDLASRDLERLQRDRSWVRPPDTLAQELAGALRSRDTGLLEQLASPTHFSFGLVGSERRFVEPDLFLRQIGEDLAVSDVAANPVSLGGSGGKLYLKTHGWDGAFFWGSVLFILTRAPGGFEWSGVALTQRRHRNGEPPDLPDDPREDPPDLPADPPPGQGSTPTSPPVTPASLGMKAPWPAGENLRAGGIVGFVAQLAAFAAIAAPAGPFAPLVYAGLLAAASLTTPCGFGPGGLYYGQPSTHVGRDTFAIDFSRFVQGVPLLLDAFGKPILAVADGVVTFVRSNIATGDPTIDNQVVIGHMTEIEVLLAFLIEALTGQPVRAKYSSEYLHLAGPGLIPVSVGMFVRQGARLGLLDDTGLSVEHHLHFSLHDRDLPAAADSVRPTPMDGQTLQDWDDGRCMFSTNVPIP
jgi:Tetratricopeptide repeat/Peptidase family M23